MTEQPNPNELLLITREELERCCSQMSAAGYKVSANYVEASVLSRSRPQPPATCAWILDEEYQMYETGCGNAFECIEGDIEENNFKFCPYCGGKIVGCPITPELNEEKKPGCFGAWGLPSCNTPGCAWFTRITGELQADVDIWKLTAQGFFKKPDDWPVSAHGGKGGYQPRNEKLIAFLELHRDMVTLFQTTTAPDTQDFEQAAALIYATAKEAADKAMKDFPGGA